MLTYAPRPLKPGQLIKLREDGPTLKVERVSPAAAYIRSQETRHVTIRDSFGSVVREFDGTVGGMLAISRNSFVYPAENA